MLKTELENENGFLVYGVEVVTPEKFIVDIKVDTGWGRLNNILGLLSFMSFSVMICLCAKKTGERLRSSTGKLSMSAQNLLKLLPREGENVKLRQNRMIKTAMVFIGFLGIIAGVRFWYLEEQGNFHPITPGEAYRSAQLDRDELEYYTRKFKIHSIINLRGQNVGESWYRQEIETSRNLGVRHFDLGLSAEKAPTPTELTELLRLFSIAPRPVLIHCQGGADRSGLAAALWKMVIDESSKSVAREQLSIRFGHMPFGPTQALDAFLENWAISKKATVEG